MSNVAAAKERSDIAHAKLAGRVQGKLDTRARASDSGSNREVTEGA
jgi:hypothetical protein